ncbi:hypothetical protein CR513_40251, partial [Mucuna pruriens]
MTAKTKINVHAGKLSMEFGDTLVQFNIFEAMKHPIENHLLFGIDLINELVEECLQLDSSGEDISDFVGDTESFDCLGSIIEEADHDEIMSAHLVLSPIRVGQPDLKAPNDVSSSLPPPIELKLLPSHLKYVYLQQEQEDKLLRILRQYMKAIGWKLSDLPGINPSICMHGILMEEEARHKATPKKDESNHPRRGQERGDKTACRRNHLPHLG